MRGGVSARPQPAAYRLAFADEQSPVGQVPCVDQIRGLGEVSRPEGRGDPDLGQCLPEALFGVESHLVRGLHGQHRELVASRPRHDVVGPHREGYTIHFPARFSANDARPSDASAVWRLAACIRTSFA